MKKNGSYTFGYIIIITSSVWEFVKYNLNHGFSFFLVNYTVVCSSLVTDKIFTVLCVLRLRFYELKLAKLAFLFLGRIYSRSSPTLGILRTFILYVAAN